MGIAATVASNEVRNSFLRVQQILHNLRFSTVISFCYAVMVTCLQNTSQNTDCLVLEFTKWKGWTQFCSTASMDEEIFASAALAPCMASFPFSVSGKTETLMTLAFWLNRSKSSHHGFQSFLFLFFSFLYLIAINLSASSSIKNLICVVHTGVTPYGLIPGGGGLPYKINIWTRFWNLLGSSSSKDGAFGYLLEYWHEKKNI